MRLKPASIIDTRVEWIEAFDPHRGTGLVRRGTVQGAKRGEYLISGNWISTNMLRDFKQVTLTQKQVTSLIEALRLLYFGAKRAQEAGVIQPQLNGGVVLAEAALKSIGEQV